MERTDYGLVTNKARPMDLTDEALYGYEDGAAAGQGMPSPASITPAKQNGLLGEYQTAAREFVAAADAGAELDKYVKWFKELLA